MKFIILRGHLHSIDDESYGIVFHDTVLLFNYTVLSNVRGVKEYNIAHYVVSVSVYSTSQFGKWCRNSVGVAIIYCGRTMSFVI